MTKHRKHKVNEAFYTETIGITAGHFIKLKNEERYYNEFHNEFLSFNMADRFTLKRAREIAKTYNAVANKETEIVTLKDLTKK